VKLFFCPKFPDISDSTALFEKPQASVAYPFAKRENEYGALVE